MTAYTYSRVAALNFNTTPPTVARSATGSVYAIADTTFTTPLTITMVVGGSTTTTVSSDSNGFFPDFTVADRVSVVWKQAASSFTTVLTTTDPVPGPTGATGAAGATGAKGDRGDLATWQTATFYPLNQAIINPSGDIVKVITAHTSGGSYDATKFDYANNTVVDSQTAAKINDGASATRAALNATYDALGAAATAAAPKLDSATAATTYAAKSVETTKLDKTEAATTYNKRGAVSSPAQVAATIHKLQAGVEPVLITAMGDSTGAMVGSWLNGLVTKLAQSFPGYSLIQRDFNDTNQRYEPSYTVQTGTSGLMRLVSTGASTDRFFIVPDSAATSPTADLDVRFKVKIPAFGGVIILGGKYDTATNNRAWFAQIDTSGNLQLFFSVDGTSGTQYTRTSNSPIPSSLLNTVVWLRIVFDVDNGASGNAFSTYYSTDNTNWTQFGTTITNAGVQSIFDSNSSTQFNGRGLSGNTTGGAVEYYACQVYTSLATGARPVIDLNAALWNGYGSNFRAGGANIATFTDFVGNTVYVDGTGQGGTLTGSPTVFFLNGCVSGTAIAYANDATRFPKLTPAPSDLCFINYSHNEIGTVYYRTPFKQLADAVLAKWPDCGIIATVQNKRYSPAANLTEHQIRGDQISTLAAAQRYGMVNAFKILEATGTQQQYVNTDGIHPTIPSNVNPGYGAGADVIRDGAWPLFSAWL